MRVAQAVSYPACSEPAGAESARLCYTVSGGDSVLGGGGGNVAPNTADSFVNTDGRSGLPNTGGGGGGSLTVAAESGASQQTGGSGGSGIVIVEAFF